jgi:hypothetical protein
MAEQDRPDMISTSVPLRPAQKEPSIFTWSQDKRNIGVSNEPLIYTGSAGGAKPSLQPSKNPPLYIEKSIDDGKDKNEAAHGMQDNRAGAPTKTRNASEHTQIEPKENPERDEQDDIYGEGSKH